jgi:hypothetical protein
MRTPDPSVVNLLHTLAGDQANLAYPSMPSYLLRGSRFLNSESATNLLLPSFSSSNTSMYCTSLGVMNGLWSNSMMPNLPSSTPMGARLESSLPVAQSANLNRFMGHQIAGMSYAPQSSAEVWQARALLTAVQRNRAAENILSSLSDSAALQSLLWGVDHSKCR